MRERTFKGLASAVRGVLLGVLGTALACAIQMPMAASAFPFCPVVDSYGDVIPYISIGDNVAGCNLTGANLATATLLGVNFTNADLRYADLTTADLTGADLRTANLRYADLASANFTNANLINADLRDTDLRNANFTNANLTGARLESATLENANFTGAVVAGAMFTPSSVLDTRVGDFKYSYQCADVACDTFEPGLRLVAYTGSSASVTIPGSALDLDVTRIDGGVFDDPSDITSVTFANTLTTIGYGAFAGTRLTSLTLPTSLVSIEATAFYGIATLEGSLSIPDSVTSIGNNAFKGTGFTSLTLGSSVQSIGVSAFEGIPASGSLSIPSSTTSIGASAFYGTSFNGGLTLRSGLTTIGESAFEVLPSHGFIGGLTIPASVTSIGSYAFRGNEFTTLTIMSGPSEMTIGTSAFAGISSFAGSLTVPARVVSIDAFAFDSAGFTGTLLLPNSLATISQGAFNSTGFTGVTLGNSLTSIGESAFSNVPIVGPLTLPAGLTSVGSQAFYNTRITALTIPSSVTSIGPDAFSSIEELTASITLPSGLTSLGSAAFYGSGVTGSVVIPSAVTAVPASVLGATQVSAVTLPSGLTSIGAQAFWRTSIETITFPSTLTSIGAQAFALRLAGSTDITGGTFTFEGPAPTIDATAFQGADGLVVRYPEGAAGWPLPSALFGTASTQTPIPGPPSPSPAPSESPSTTSTPSSSPSLSPITTATAITITTPPAGQATSLAPGTATMLIGGDPRELVRKPSRGGGFTLSGGGVVVDAVPPPTGFSSGGSSSVVMSGYAPDSSVGAFLFSDPVSLGTLAVGPDGAARGRIVIPESIRPGRHTLQFTGWNANGESVILSAGITVKPQVTRVVHAVPFKRGSAKLTPVGRAAIVRAVASSAALAGSIRTTVSYVKDIGSAAITLAKSRARVVARELTARGLPASIAAIHFSADKLSAWRTNTVVITSTG